MALPPSFTVANAIEESFERIGFDPAKLVAAHLVSAIRSIRLMLASWNTDGVLFWKVGVGNSHTVTENEVIFTADTGTIDVLQAGLLRNDLLTPMLPLSITDWFAIPDRAVAKGMPTRFWCDRHSAENGIVSIRYYPMAENSTDAIVYDELRYFNDVGSLPSPTEVPERWNQAFCAGLAFFLAEKYAPARMAEKEAIYGGPGKMGGAYAQARSGDRERGDTVFTLQRHRRQRR